MVKPEKFDHLYLVNHFTVPLNCERKNANSVNEKTQNGYILVYLPIRETLKGSFLPFSVPFSSF